jgi:ribosome-binding factor A
MAIDLFVSERPKSHRQFRVAQEIRQLIAEIFTRGDLPPCVDENNEPVRISSSITVTHVDVSPDLRHARVFVMPLGGADTEFVVLYLKEVQGFFRKSIAKSLRLRFVPELTFHVDKGFSYDEKIDSIFAKIKPENEDAPE